MKNVLHSHPGLIRNGWNKRKFRPGVPVKSLDELVIIARSGAWFYGDMNTPKHASIFLNQQVGCIARRIERKSLRIAIRAPEFPYVFKAEWMAHSHNPDLECYWAKCSEIPAAKCEQRTRQATLESCIKIARAHTGRDDVRVTVEFDN